MSPSLKPKLLFVCSRLPYPPIGGDRLKNYYLIPELAKTFDLSIVCTGSEPLAPEARSYLERYGELHFFPRSRATFLKSLLLWPLRLPVPLQAGIYYFPDVQKRIDELAQSHDGILCNIIRTARYAKNLSIARFCDIGDNNGVYYATLLRRKRPSPMSLYCLLDQPLIERYEKHVIDTFDQSFLFNQEELEQYCAPSKLTLIPHGVNPELHREHPADSEFGHTLVFLGKMDTVPNVLAVDWFATRVMPTLPPHIHFAIIGANPSRRVQALASDRVKVLGFVRDPYPALRGALAVVAPMQLGRGIQNKVLEAMAVGALCILTSSPAMAFEEQGRREALLIADTPEEYVRLIIDIAAKPAAYDSMRSAARSYIAENHSWERAGKIYTAAIQRVLSER